jgi:rhodanese-related sulfurtransferase
MRGRTRGVVDAYTSPHETLVAASSRPNSQALAAPMVLANPCVVFHPCTCGLRRGDAAVAAMLIGYDDVKVVAGMTTRRWS